jgi:hypothetical protein
MRLYLINPSNPLVAITQVKESRWNCFRVWKPLSLMVLAGLTPPEWKISILDENLGVPDYKSMPRPDLVGITTFASQGCFFTFKINLKKAILS